MTTTITANQHLIATAADRITESLDFARAAMVPGASNDPCEPLHWLTDAALRLDDARTAAVRHARAHGASWSQIGADLGVSKQAAQQRYGYLDR